MYKCLNFENCIEEQCHIRNLAEIMYLFHKNSTKLSHRYNYKALGDDVVVILDNNLSKYYITSKRDVS